MKSFKKITTCFIAICVVFSLIIVSFAEDIIPPKEETVYAILNYDGKVKNIYVVNSFDLDKPTLLTDYGDYSSVRNLTTKDEIKYSNGMIKINAPAGKLYYQGNSDSKEIPWDININYKLDNKSIDAKELIGKSGLFEITIEIQKNREIKNDFFEDFALQISMSLDTEKFKNIEAEGAALANAGKNKSITFTHLPSKEKSYTVKATVSDFEMTPIQINGIVLVLNSEFDNMDEMTGEFTKLSSGIAKIAEGAKKIENGSGEFKKGIGTFSESTKQLANSSNQINNGLAQSAGGISELLKNSTQLKELANTLSSSSDPQVQAFAKGYLSQMADMEQLSAGLGNIADQYAQCNGGIVQISQGAAKVSDNYEDIHKGIESISDGTNELKDKTSSLTSKVNTKIDEMLTQYTNNDYIPISFVSELNTNVNALQFVMRTDALEHKEVQRSTYTKEQTLNFWQRLLKLFGLYKE